MIGKSFIKNKVASVILAGGLSRRMNNKNKALIKLKNKPLISYVLSIITKQSDYIVINSNRNSEEFEKFGFDVVKDSISNFPGPLAGVLSGMDWLNEKHPECKWIFTCPTDAPFLPNDIIKKLYDICSKKNKLISVAQSNGRVHPVFALWHMSLREKLRNSINSGVRKVDKFTFDYSPSVVNFEDNKDPFFNINSPEDLIHAETFVN